MYTLKLKQDLPFASVPTLVELDGSKILLNDVNLPEHIEHSYNPHNVRLWVIGHTFGALCAVWASCEQDALDEAVDNNMLDCLMAEGACEDEEDLTPLGNASELFDLSYAWIGEVEFDAARDIKLIVHLVRHTERGDDDLGGA